MRFIVSSYAYQLDSNCRKLSTQAENYSKATNKSSLKNNQRGELLWYYEMRQLFSMQVVSNLNVEAWNVHPPVSRLLKTCVLMSHTDNSCLFVCLFFTMVSYQNNTTFDPKKLTYKIM